MSSQGDRQRSPQTDLPRENKTGSRRDTQRLLGPLKWVAANLATQGMMNLEPTPLAVRLGVPAGSIIVAAARSDKLKAMLKGKDAGTATRDGEKPRRSIQEKILRRDPDRSAMVGSSGDTPMIGGKTLQAGLTEVIDKATQAREDGAAQIAKPEETEHP